ncbi:energy transducer TonB [Pseudomonas fontis]|uniref:TonB family protein n=1 Tax=Pseudomonas fontis TaxID=2942633 RepID=A0ABT5NY46_9PSED|nr:energy transducer TonB [Pseudomonas fontis]MDD0972528.1 TonB family protein [Pseudomonas fontis]MDD0993052.1 TonB family protein [Pseudomonas fontis]
MSRLASYLTLSVLLHFCAGWLLHGLVARPAASATQLPTAIQIVDLAPLLQSTPTPPARPVAPPPPATPSVTPKVPVMAKAAALLPPPSAKAAKPNVAKAPAPPRIEPPARPVASAPAVPAPAVSRPTPERIAQAATAAAVQQPLTPVVSQRPNFAAPPQPPRYPSQARRRNQHGIVRVEVSLDERGQQLKLVVTRSSGVESLDEAALEAVGKWRFRPEIVDGRAVPSRVEIPIEFALTANR